MRLSTEPDRNDENATAVLHAALDSGIELSDTADAYCRDESDIGHNERLVARALATWSGNRSRVRAATKGGLTRPGGQWVPDGRARHLREACERSLASLGSWAPSVSATSPSGRSTRLDGLPRSPPSKWS
jgi:aryl-alcohol dehydrogenase-like predicted oxidoreductase